jgi:hypothetical protein
MSNDGRYTLSYHNKFIDVNGKVNLPEFGREIFLMYGREFFSPHGWIAFRCLIFGVKSNTIGGEKVER